MAKFGNMTGQQQTPPKSRPLDLPGVKPPGGDKPAPTGLFGITPNPQLVNALVKSAMTSAQDSGSPLLAALAPIAGALISAKADGNLNALSSAGRDAALSPFAGDGMGAFDLSLEDMDAYIEDPNTPEYLRQFYEGEIKRRMKETLENGPPVRRNAPPRRAPPPSAPPPAASNTPPPIAPDIEAPVTPLADPNDPLGIRGIPRA